MDVGLILTIVFGVLGSAIGIYYGRKNQRVRFWGSKVITRVKGIAQVSEIEYEGRRLKKCHPIVIPRRTIRISPSGQETIEETAEGYHFDGKKVNSFRREP